MKRAYTVTRDQGGRNEHRIEYEGFNCNPEGARYRLEVDRDLGVGPFYCGADLGVAACSLLRYLESEYGRTSNPKVFDLWYQVPVGNRHPCYAALADELFDAGTLVERYAATMSRLMAEHKEEQIKGLIDANYNGGFRQFERDLEGIG